jgi:hypothetical protein
MMTATLYKIGSIRLNASAALALGQAPVGPDFFLLPPAERPLLRVSLHWDRSTHLLTLRGGEGPFKLHVYRHARCPLFLLIASAFFRRSRGLRVPAARRFPLSETADRTLVLNREGESVKVSHRRSSRVRRYA